MANEEMRLESELRCGAADTNKTNKQKHVVEVTPHVATRKPLNDAREYSCVILVQ